MTQRRRISFVIPTMEPGGTERQLLLLMEGLAEEFDLTLICTREEGALFEAARKFAAHTHVLRHSSGWDFQLKGKLRPIFREERPDVVQSFLFGFDYWAAAAARREGVPVVITTRRELAEWQQARHLWLVRKASVIADVIVANSHAVASYAAEHEDEAESRYRVIYNGLHVRDFESQDPVAARTRFGIPLGVPVVGMAANFTEIKDHNLFLFASNRVGIPNAHYFMLGKGPSRESIERGMGNSLGPERVHVRHTLDEMPLAYAAMDVCVLTSKMEGAPNVLIEAMAAARPIVAPAVGGIPEIVVHGETGLLESFREPVFFAEKIRLLLDDPELRTRMGAAGRARVRTHFSVERMVGEYKALYHELLDAKQQRAT